MNITWLKPTDKKAISDKETVALIAIDDVLIGHYFESEKEALRLMPNIKGSEWKRETWDDRHIRYHHRSAEKFWRNLSRRHVTRLSDMSFRSTRITYKDGKKIVDYSKPSTHNRKQH